MEITIITFCLIGAVFANPISYNFLLESSDLNANTTESLSISQSSENDTSEIQSSEENSSHQSSESESLESTSEDKTSEESNSQSDEDDGIDSVDETRDDSMGSEENVRKNWVQAFASVTKDLSAEDNSSAEVQGQTDHQSHEATEKQSTHTMTFKRRINLPLEDNTSDSSESSSSESTGATAAPSDSSESSSSESTGATAAPSDSSDSSSSSESSETSDSSDASKSTEDSEASDSAEVEHITTKDCVNGTQSCESEEYFFQDIGDDAHYAVDNLMVPDDDEREFSLRR